MTLQQLINTHNQKIMEFQNLVSKGALAPEEIQLRQQEINQLRDQITTIQQQMKSNKSNTNINIESFIGKNIMAVVASLLIFISIIVMCGAMIPFLGDYGKTFLSFGISTVITAIGCFLLYKKKSGWSITITSCGLVSIYISAIVSNLALKTLNDTILYIVIMLWVVWALTLARKYTSIFEVISLAGIAISAQLNYISLRNDNISIGSTIAIAIVGFTVLFIGKTHDKSWKELPKDMFATYFMSLSVFSLLYILHNYDYIWESSNIIFYETVIGIAITTTLIVLYNIKRYYKYTLEKWDLGFSLVTVTEIVVLTIQFNAMYSFYEYNNQDTIGIICFYTGVVISIVSALILGQLVLKTYKTNSTTDIIKSLLELMPTAYLIVSIYRTLFVAQIGVFLPLAIITIYLGFKIKNTTLKYIGFLIYTISHFSVPIEIKYNIQIISDSSTQVMLHIILSIITFILVMWMIQTYKEQYSGLFKAFMIISLIIGVMFENISSLDISDNWVLVTTLRSGILLIVSMVMIHTKLGNNPNTQVKDKPLEITFRVLSELTILWVSGNLIAAYNNDNIKVLATIMSLILLGFSAINTKIQINMQYREYLALYNIYKFTMVSWFITTILFHVNIVTSAISLLISIIGISLGFKLKLEYIRIYGLILSILIIIKISFVDIQLKGSFGTAICLFICGVLCFGISFTYNRLDKVIGGKDIEDINMHQEN